MDWIGFLKIWNKDDGPDGIDDSDVGLEQTAPPETDLQFPEQIELLGNLYHLGKPSQGGISVVAQATPEDPDLPNLALKMVREKWRDHVGVRRQFAGESSIVKSLDHPQLPRFVTRGRTNKQPYYAYEYFDGMPLIRLCQETEDFPPEETRKDAHRYISQLLEQLDYLHTRDNPVVHGDISSENVLLNAEEKVFLLDFGCAHLQHHPQPESFQWIAKPSFISPEQARGDRWDSRSDLYQIGIVYYELVTSKRWNRGRNKREKILFAGSNSPPPRKELMDLVGTKEATVLCGLLEPNPEHRYATAKEALDELR